MSHGSSARGLWQAAALPVLLPAGHPLPPPGSYVILTARQLRSL